MKKIPLFGTGIAGKSLVVTDQRRINCYYEIRQDGDKSDIVIYGTPGTTLFANLGTQLIRGMYVIGSFLYVVQGSGVFKLDINATSTFIGALNTNTGFVSMSDNGTQMMIVDGTNGYIVTIATGVLAQITDVDFPNGATTVAFLDGFFLVNKVGTGQFFKSASYDGTSWDPLDFATAESNPDNLVAVDTDHSLAILWGDNSIEFWQNTGSLGFPFAPIKSATQQWGLAAVFSRTKYNNGFAFLAKNLQGQVQVMFMQGYTITPISTPDINNIINGFTVNSDAVGFSYMLDGHPMYQINFQSAGKSFLYDASTGMWSEVMSGVGLTGQHIALQCIAFNKFNFVSDFQTGNLYKLLSTVYQDNGMPIKRLIQTRHIEDNGNVMTIDELFIDMETGVGLQTGQGTNPQIMVEVSKDGGRTYGYQRWMSLGMVGQYLGPRAIMRRFGSARDFVFRISMTDPVKFAVTYGAAVTRGLGK